MERWIDYFHRNRAAMPPVDWERGAALPEEMRGPLLHSLRRFQIGESGEGKKLKAGAARTGDPLYAEAIGLFLEEEHEHARRLGGLIDALGGTRMTSHWSDAAFIGLRRLGGHFVELAVLLTAELIAVRYYRALDEGIDDPLCRMVFRQIRRDEDGHVAFHLAYLRPRLSALPTHRRWLYQMLWRVFFRAACLLVMLDHRGVLRATGVTWGVFWRDAGAIFDAVVGTIFTPAYAAVTGNPLPEPRAT